MTLLLVFPIIPFLLHKVRRILGKQETLFLLQELLVRLLEILLTHQIRINPMIRIISEARLRTQVQDWEILSAHVHLHRLLQDLMLDLISKEVNILRMIMVLKDSSKMMN